MLIRSQDKRSLINMDRVVTVNIGYDGYINCYYSGDIDDFETIAEYATEEKAVMVMDALQKAYGVYGSKAIFQLPQDDEVEV